MKLFVDQFWAVCSFDHGDEDYKYLKDYEGELEEIDSNDVFEFTVEQECEILECHGSFLEALDFAKTLGNGTIIRVGALYGGRLV